MKAGGSWNIQLKIPEAIREKAGKARDLATEDVAPSVTWIIEVASQILFSQSATVHFEIVVGRDEQSIDFGFTGLLGTPNSIPGQLTDHQRKRDHKDHHHEGYGIYSKAILLVVEDTAALWDKPELPHFNDSDGNPIVNPVLAETDPKTIKVEQNLGDTKQYGDSSKPQPINKKRVHLVVITHGLHSNLGADMLYLKESIDSTAKQAKLDKQMRRAKRQAKQHKKSSAHHNVDSSATQDETGAADTRKESLSKTDDDEDEGEISEDEEVIVRGFAGNAVKTERGIQYLGKRLAKYVLSVTYPDQPYLPVKQVKSPLAKAFSSNNNNDATPSHPRQHPAHKGSSILKEAVSTENLAYQITSISFIGHSLGGLTQTYAIAYIHKHSPDFFKRIRPVNFVALATPFLGLSNENPIYVKFALDFGLVGRTGQDLGLTWRAPTLARNGWSAMIAGIGTQGQRKQRQLDPGSKPLLRILPAGPAHQVLRLFKNRTVYSNVVNDGVVPLRTSCLLFLDWRGLGRVEKARRGNGVIGTVANWGWAELTGANASEYQRFKFWFDNDGSSANDLSLEDGQITPRTKEAGRQVPQPSAAATQEDNTQTDDGIPDSRQFLKPPPQPLDLQSRSDAPSDRPASPGSSPLTGFLSLFKPSGGTSKPKTKKIYRRGQTMDVRSDDETYSGPTTPDAQQSDRSEFIGQDSTSGNANSVFTPPATSIFESASDILNPPIPTLEYLTDPTARPRTIFHDRVYHPDDIPPPPTSKKRFSLRRNKSSDINTISSKHSSASVESDSSTVNAESGSMKVEEKIARAYHRDLSWRKVLVSLEPDAHNNLVVRRMFSNAYGWPVVKHLVDTHFADSYTARTADELEDNTERALPMYQPADSDGDEVLERPKGDKTYRRRASVGSSHAEARDSLPDLQDTTSSTHSGSNRPRIARADSAVWDDRFFTSDSEDDDDEEFEPQRSPQLQPVGHTSTVKNSDDVQHNLDSRIMPPAISDTTANAQPIVTSKLTSSPTRENSLGLRAPPKDQSAPHDTAHSTSNYGAP